MTSAVASRLARVANSTTRAWGEPITLPSATVVQGIYHPFDPRAQGEGEMGRVMRPSQQPNPAVALRSDQVTAEALSEGQVLQARGADWRIARIDPDGHGMSLLSLAPAQDAPSPDNRRWR